MPLTRSALLIATLGLVAPTAFSQDATPLIRSINDMARDFSARVNAQLAAGYDLDGAPGATLFEFDSASSTGMRRRPGPRRRSAACSRRARSRPRACPPAGRHR